MLNRVMVVPDEIQDFNEYENLLDYKKELEDNIKFYEKIISDYKSTIRNINNVTEPYFRKKICLKER